MASPWDGKDEDELTEAIDEAESGKDLTSLVGIMVHATAGDPDDMGTVRAKAYVGITLFLLVASFTPP